MIINLIKNSINSENNQTSDPHRLLLNILGKTN